MKKVLVLLTLLCVIISSCQKESKSLDNVNELNNSHKISTTDSTLVANPDVVNGILKFESFDHVYNFIEQKSEAELLAIYTVLSFTNNNLSNSTLMDESNPQHKSYRVLNNNNTVIIGDYLCRLDSGIYFITSNVSNYTSYSEFETTTFDATTMKRFGVYIERDSTFSLENSMASIDDIAETYTMPLDPSAQAVWKFWGTETGCHPAFEMPDPRANPNGPIKFRCERFCWKSTYIFGIRVFTDSWLEVDVPCN